MAKDDFTIYQGEPEKSPLGNFSEKYWNKEWRRKVRPYAIGALVILIALYFLTPIVKSQFFPSNAEQLSKQWSRALAKCGFSNVVVTIGYKSDQLYVNYDPAMLSAEGRFKSSPKGKQCLTDEFDTIYKSFNLTQGAKRKATWFCGNFNSGSWNNDYAGSEETYTLEHIWLDY